MVCFAAKGQFTIQGTVVERATQTPIPYASVALRSKPSGTVADSLGNFSITFPVDYDIDSLTISAIGYYSISVPVSHAALRLKKVFELPLRPFPLDEVIVVSNWGKVRFYGNKSMGKILKAGFDGGVMLGEEIGVNLKLEKPVVLESIHLSVLKCTYDTLFYRVNIYQKNLANRYQSILQKPIYFKLARQNVKKFTAIDVSQENLILEGDCIIALESVKNLGQGVLWLGAEMLTKSRMYYRKTHLAEWEKMPFGIGIGIRGKHLIEGQSP